MNYADELAGLFKDRNNKKVLGPQTGVIKSVSPLIISLLDGQILLDSDNILICRSLVENSKVYADIKISGTTSGAEITYKQVLTVGDMVLCLPANNKFIVVDKVEVV